MKILDELSTILASPIEEIRAEGLAIAVSNLGPYVWDKLSAESVKELLNKLEDEYKKIQQHNSLPANNDDPFGGTIPTDEIEKALDNLSFVYRYITGTMTVGLKIVVTEDNEIHVTRNGTFDPHKEFPFLRDKDIEI